MAFLELFDETLDINSTENYELAIQAGPDGFSFCLLDTLRNKFVLIRSFEPEDNKYYSSEIVKELIDKDDFLARSYRKTRVIMPSSKFTLVPAPLYDPAKKDEYFTLNHKHEENSRIISNKITDPDAYVISSVSASLHDLLSNVYPAVHPCVHMQPLFDHISAVRKAVSGNYIHVHVERDYFNLIIFTDNQLKFCNTYSYRNISDILYFVLNVFTRHGIKQEETIYFSGLTEKYDDLTSGFSIYVKNIKFSEPKGTFTFSYVFNEIGLHKFLNLFSVFN
jgi:hypothetical protein